MKIENALLRCPLMGEQELQDRRLMLQYLSEFPNLYSRSNETAHFTASGWIVNADRTRVLMVYHKLYDSWSWTGGHADGDENLLRVALKEAQEECGLEQVRALSDDVFSLEILPVAAHFRRGKFVSAHLHLNVTFLLEADDRQPIFCKPDENSAVRWFSTDDAVLASTEPHMRVIFRKLNDKLRNFSPSPRNF